MIKSLDAETTNIAVAGPWRSKNVAASAILNFEKLSSYGQNVGKPLRDVNLFVQWYVYKFLICFVLHQTALTLCNMGRRMPGYPIISLRSITSTSVWKPRVI